MLMKHMIVSVMSKCTFKKHYEGEQYHLSFPLLSVTKQILPSFCSDSHLSLDTQTGQICIWILLFLSRRNQARNLITECH